MAARPTPVLVLLGATIAFFELICPVIALPWNIDPEQLDVSSLLPSHGQEILRRAEDRTPCSFEYPLIDTSEPPRFQDNCPGRNVVVDGHCPVPDKPNGDSGCTVYCQQRIRLSYGREQPFQSGMNCATKQECELAVADAVSTTTGYELQTNLGFGFEIPGQSIEAAFNIGATMQWSETLTHSVEETWKRTLDMDERSGKFVFVPLLFQSCGIMSSAPEEDNIEPCIPIGQQCTVEQADYVCVKDKAGEKTDYCQAPAPVKSTETGQTKGWLLFVALCDVGSSACGEGQDPIYYQPGVSADEGFKNVAKPETSREKSRKVT